MFVIIYPSIYINISVILALRKPFGIVAVIKLFVKKQLPNVNDMIFLVELKVTKDIKTLMN